MFRILIKSVIYIFKFLGFLLGGLLLYFYIQYITCPVYDFHPGQKFQGEHLYNPYENLDPDSWLRGNFQIQSHAWGGITSGRGNTNEKIHSLYKRFGYDIIATSDYQKINRYGEDRPGYLPVYEHGYGFRKNHQVLIGSERVLWKDYPLFQTIHNKQHIIQSLRKDNALIFLAHPKLRAGYTFEDMRILSGYNGIEALNNCCISMEYWDEALSQGNYVTLLANDDVHDISNPDEVGNYSTYVNSSSLNSDSIIKAFKTGNTLGARIRRTKGETMEDRINRLRVLPRLIRHDLNGDTLTVQCDSVVDYIRFIGQDGIVIKTLENSNQAHYVIKATDTYIRAEILFWNECYLHMNPVCRYNGITPGEIPPPEINPLKTWILRIVGFATLIFIAANIILIRRRMKRWSSSFNS